MSSPVEFVRAVFKHWGVLVTSGAGIGALGIWQGTGHFTPHWVYWLVAAIGLIGASYKAWLSEHQKVSRLTEGLEGFHQENRRELIQVITALQAMQVEVLRWRDIVKDKFGMAHGTVSLLPVEWPIILFQATKISADLRAQVEAVGKNVTEATSTISEFLRVQPGYRDERLMPVAYRLLDEAAPRLSSVITEFEAHEKSLG